MKLIAKEHILPNNMSGRNCHASSCLPLADGSVLAVWFEGTKEGANDVCIHSSIRTPDGIWRPKARITEDNGLPHWNPVLMQLDPDTIILYYKEGTPIAKWYTLYQISKDGGQTWSASRELVPGDIGGRGPVRNKPIRLSNGWLLAPASLEETIWTCFMDLSKNNGATWRRSQAINIFHSERSGASLLEKRLDNSILRRKRGVIQPTIWESRPGRIHALMRSSEGRIYASDSHDYGKTWSKPKKTLLPNNNSGIDAVRLPDGRIYLAYNPVAQNWGKRYPMALACSRNNGVSWRPPVILQNGSGKDELSYPCLRYLNGRLYLTYTENRTNLAFWILEP